jgi:hypothetical protein
LLSTNDQLDLAIERNKGDFFASASHKSAFGQTLFAIARVIPALDSTNSSTYPKSKAAQKI